jgi:stress response protein YsnF
MRLGQAMLVWALARWAADEAPCSQNESHTDISLVEEVLVVEKRWMLREEIHIRTQRLETHQPQRITLRSEDVHVERVPRRDT